MATGGLSCTALAWDPVAVGQSIISERAERFSTVYATAFLPHPLLPDQTLLATAYSTGTIKLYHVRDAVTTWLSKGTSPSAFFSWKAHSSAVTSLTCIGTGSAALLVSGGDDGFLHVWNVTHLVTLSATSHTNGRSSSSDHGNTATSMAVDGMPSATSTTTQPRPVLSVRIPAAPSQACWGMGASGNGVPGITCAAADTRRGHSVVVGATDGGVHVVDVGAAVTKQPAGQAGSRAAELQASQVVASWGGHLAGVLDLDICPVTGRVATASEDGTVRLWDTQTPGGCVGLICPANGATLEVPCAPGPTLAIARAQPAVTTVRFERSQGSWLVCGVAGTGAPGSPNGPALITWSLDAGAKALTTPLPCVPQALAVLPGEVLVAGTAPTLYRYSFMGSLTSTHPLPSKARSVFSLSVLSSEAIQGAGPTESAGITLGQQGSMRGSGVAPGALALGGAGACVDVLSRYGTPLAAVQPINTED